MHKVLVANRGEIAVRIMRTLREMNISSIAVYSDVDQDALHVRMADQAYPIGPAPAAQSYLNRERILDAAQKAGADGLHPGYGFLSENAEFAAECEASGVRFIGPPASAIAAMGSKVQARAHMLAAGVPIVPGASATNVQEALHNAPTLGFPILIKANAGGGGKGMRLVHDEAQLSAAFERAQSEAQRAFGDGTVYLEKAIQNPRHVEIQILADQHGNTVHLFERDCSIQRRHQKVIEETPCPALPSGLVERMGEISIQGARAIGYFSAGTFEFLLGEDAQFYFLEMNTRLQVEHPITELTTGVDLVREMVGIARGEKLPFDQATLARRGAALECRIYAEDPARNFLPSPGSIEFLRVPAGPGVRDDSGIVQGYRVTPHYDPLLSKLSVWAPTRKQALERMRRALWEYRIVGLHSNLEFHRRALEHPEFVAGTYTTAFIERHADALLKPAAPSARDLRDVTIAIAAAHAHDEITTGQAQAARAQPVTSAWSTRERHEPDES